MPKEIVIPYHPHDYQRAFHDSGARFRLFIAGRRGGKTMGAANEGVKLATSIPRGMGWIVAPTYPMSRVAWREFLKWLPKQLIAEQNKSERWVRLINGHLIECHSAHRPEDLVGVGLDWLWVDEAARVQKAAWEENLRPTLTDRKGKAFFTTTPRGRNWVWDLFCLGEDRARGEYANFHFRTEDNPHIDPAEVELARQTLPEMVFRQEYLAEFLDDVSQVFRYVRRQATGRFEEPQAVPYVLGVDLAKVVDFTVLTVMRQDTGQVVAWDRFNQLDWSLQKQRIKALADRYNKAQVWIDTTGVGDPVFEDLRGMGLRVEGFQFTSTSKKQLIEHLAMEIEQGRVTYPDIPELVNELQSYEYEISRAGNVSYNAPEGQHDDCVISLALATWGREHARHPARVTSKPRGF